MRETKNEVQKRDPKEKAKIVLEYLTTHNTAETCRQTGIHNRRDNFGIKKRKTGYIKKKVYKKRSRC
jgi:hypothetical protein